MGATRAANFGNRVRNPVILLDWTCTVEICQGKRSFAHMGQNDRNVGFEFPVAVLVALVTFMASPWDSNQPHSML
jgi:hypothetical protein